MFKLLGDLSMRNFAFITLCLIFLANANLSLASMPVEVKITGCIEKGYLYAEETDFGTHKVSRKDAPIKNKIKSVEKDFKPIDLSSHEGKRIKVSGALLPGDTFIIEQNSIKVLEWCKNKKQSWGEKENPKNRKLSLNEQGDMLSEDRAQRIIWGLPEVKKHSARVKSMGKRLFTRIDSRLEGESGEKFFYIIYLGEDHGTHAVNLMTFYVNASTEEIYVYDPILDIKYPHEQWRMMQK